MRKMTEEEAAAFKQYSIDPERCSCNDCIRNEVCEFSFDPYNTDDDCLELK